MMTNTLKLFSFLFLILLAPSASAESIYVSMPSSGTAGSSAYVYAYYYDNESALIPYATCTLSEGFLSSPVNFYYDSSNSRYTHYLYLSSAGSYNLKTTCSKAGYLEQSDTEPISIAKGYSNLYLNSIPGEVNIGDSVYVEARYEHGSHISGADCNLIVNEPSGTSAITKDMSEGVSSYHYTYPLSDIGSYSFEVSCSSSKYLSASRPFNIISTKKSTTLSHSAISSGYYPGDPIIIHYYYRSGSEWITGASCTYALKKSGASIDTGNLKYTSQGYSLSLNNIQASDTPYSLDVACDAGLYSKAYNSANIYVREIQTMIDINVVTPNGRFSYAPINIDIKYKDSKRYATIDSPTCTISFGNKEFSGTSIETELPAVDKYRIEKIDVCCDKENYQKKCQSASVDVAPQEISIQQIFDVPRLVVGNTYELHVIAKPLSWGGSENIFCDASATVNTQGSLLEKQVDLKKRDNEFYALMSFDEPGQATITTSCKGAGYIQNIAAKTIKINMFEEKYENTLTKVLGAAGIVLLSALFIIRKKFKV
ncbi:MAG: hypothetical protein KAJ91_01375 [Candidatus Aenigmarchaeota archaeon]|nr:hypothetical protein [Candidatus Aenigmarchaeota archaeon]